MSYKFTYDQNGNAYHLKGGKHTCPGCKHHSLQLYLREDDDEPVDDSVGKCDRIYNCGYKLKPWDYFEEHPDELPTSNGSRRPRNAKPKPLVTIPKEYVLKSMTSAEPGRCVFIDILLNMFHREDVERVCIQYYLGETKDKAVIFWQIDENGYIHEGKAMAYNFHTGGRDKASWATGESKWIFSTMQGRGLLPQDASSTKTLFGQHLLANADSDTNVCITESAKNAIFGAILFPDYLWMAADSAGEIGKIGLVKKRLSKCRSVILVPDADAVEDWSKKADGFKLGNIKVWKLCQGHAGGFDLADFVRNLWIESGCRLLTPATREDIKKEVSMVSPPKSPIAQALQMFHDEGTDPDEKLLIAQRLLRGDLPEWERERITLFVGTYLKAKKDPAFTTEDKGATSTWAYSPHKRYEMMLAKNPALVGLIDERDLHLIEDNIQIL